jgi:RNA ligase (TIGR02306 family)
MSWKVEAKRITYVKPIEGADKIEVVYLGGWPCVVQKGQYSQGDLVAYFPSESLLPEDLIEEMGLVGRLAGPQKNRVKPVKLRGERSIGLVYPAPEGVVEGQDLTDYFRVVRWEEPIPAQLHGVQRKRPPSFIKFDVENINNDLSLFEEGEDVVVTEKIHGTNAAFGLEFQEQGKSTKSSYSDQGVFHVCSRNMSLEHDPSNLYWRVAEMYKIEEYMRSLLPQLIDLYNDTLPLAGEQFTSFWLHGEIYGIQDLKYGASTNSPNIAFFNARAGHNFVPWKTFKWIFGVPDMESMPYPTAPLLYEGPYSLDLVRELAEGKEQVSGKELHIREGVVVSSPTQPWRKAKVVSNDYLFRNGGTEHH